MTRTMRRWGLWMIPALVLAVGAQAYVPYYTAAWTEVKWSSYNIPVPYFINDSGTDDIPGTLEFDVIRQSFATWENVATSTIAFSDRGLTTMSAGYIDGMNTMEFVSDPESEYGLLMTPGLLGVTLFTFDSITGEMLESDIIFNDIYTVFSATEETNVFWTISATGELALEGVVNLPNIAVHEIGHFCGLGHSFIDGVLESVIFDDVTGAYYYPDPDPVLKATMYPFEVNGSRSRILGQDDIAGVSHLYPDESFYTRQGVISGRVVSALDPSEPVFGAHLVVVGPSQRELVAGMSHRDGSFYIDGLAPGGGYTLFAEPVPYLTSLQASWSSAEQEFPQEFYDDVFSIGLGEAQPLSVAAGLTTGGIVHTLLVGFSDIDENEPNDSFQEFTEANPDTEVAGIIRPEGDRDIFRFRALRGSLIRLEVFAQRLSTQLEPLLILYDSDGVELERASSNAFLGGDARIDFRVPRGGYYYVEVADVAGEYGEGYFYLLSVMAIENVVPILPESGLTPVVAFELASDMVVPGKQLRLKEINLILEDVTTPDRPSVGAFTLEDLAEIQDSLDSGISIFNDAGLRNGQFDYQPQQPNNSDQRLPLEKSADAVSVVQGLGQVRVRLKLEDSARAVLRLQSDGNADFYVVIRTSKQLHLGDDFKVSIPAQGLVLVDDTDQSRYRAFDEPFPEFQTILTGDLLQLSAMAGVDQRISLNSEPLAVVGINAKGDPAEDYYLSELKFLVIGYNAKNFAPFFSIYGPTLGATGTYGDFNLDDLATLFYDPNDPFRGGGIALYRDEARVVMGGEVEGDGTFEPGVDLVVPFGAPQIQEISISRVQRDFLDPLTPRLFGISVFSELFLAYGFDFANALNVRAFEVTLPLRRDSLTRIPASDDAASLTGGADFFVGVQTSNRARALDSFVVYLPDEGVRIKNNFGSGGVATLDHPSLRYLDPTLEDQTLNAVTVRPQPIIEINDLTKLNPANRVLELAEQGASPKAILGVNMVDFGMDTQIISQGPSVLDPGIFLNQGYIWDTLDLDFVPVEDFERTDLREILQVASYSGQNVMFSHGVAIYMDDDTPIGNFLDDDGDGLIDEELRNGRDDDLDGVIDEPDWGDEDDAGLNGVFDPMDYDNFWPPITLTRDRYVSFVNEGQFVTTPTFPNVPQPDGSYRAHFDLLARRVNEAAYFGVAEILADPLTYSPQAIFIRTGFSPIWYGEATSSALTVAVDSPASIPDPFPVLQHGFWVTLGNDAEDYQELIDLEVEQNQEFEYSYNHVFHLPSEDGAPGYEFLGGDDVFIVLRASGTAELGDKFQVRVPTDAFGLSVYQSPDVDLNIDFADGTRSFPVSLPEGALLTDVISIGSANDAPEVEIIAPALGTNFFDIDFSYEAVFQVVDPDSSNVMINLYLDNNNLGFDGVLLNEERPLTVSESRFRFNLRDLVNASRLSRFGITDVRQLTEQNRFYVYIEADDLLNRPVRVYSDGFIIVDEDLLEDLAQYLKLDRDGVIYSLGLDRHFRSVPATWENPAADMEVLPTEDAVLVLLGQGQVYGRMLPGATLGPYERYRRISFDPLEQDRIVIPPIDFDLGANLAVDIALVPESAGYYILDSMGGVHRFGSSLIDFSQVDRRPPFFGWEIARDMELVSSRRGLYILDGMGEVHAVGDVPLFPLSDTFFGWDTARDLLLTPSENGYYVLNSDGLIARAGDARSDVQIPDVRPAAADRYRSIKRSTGGEGFLVLDATGTVTPLLESRVGSDAFLDPIHQDFVDLEVVGLTERNAEEIILEYFEAYAAEDIDRIISLTSEGYLDDHGNDRARLRQALQTIFNYFIVGLPTDNPFVIEDLSIQVSGGQAQVVASVVVSHRIPQIEVLESFEENLIEIIPFDQVVQMFEISDGRGDRLDVYDIDNPTGGFDRELGVDRIIFTRTFKNKGAEGPFKVFLEFEGPLNDNSYAFTLTDGGNLGDELPLDAEVRIARYVPGSVYAASGPVSFEFTLVQNDTSGFLIQKADVLQILPQFADEANPVGFSFERGGPVFDFQFLADDRDNNYSLGMADFLIVEGLITHSVPGFRGIANLSESLGITRFDQYRTQDYRDIPLIDFENSMEITSEDIYLVVTTDLKRYGLVRPIVLTSADVTGTAVLVFDWQLRPDFVIAQ